MTRFTWIVLLLVVGLGACTEGSVRGDDSEPDSSASGDTDADGDGDADTDSDADSDADADTDADADADTDADTDADADADTDADGDSDTSTSGCADISGDWEYTAHCLAQYVGEVLSIVQNVCTFTTSDPIDATPYTGTIDAGGAITVSDQVQQVCSGNLYGSTIELSCFSDTCAETLVRL